VMNRRHTFAMLFCNAIAICLLAFAFQQAAAAGPASAPITFTLEQAPLTDALRQIEEASGLNLAFNPELVRDAAPVTLHVVNEPAGEVLYRLLRERGLVPVYTADTMAAVVHEESFLGIAKIGGHAVRELVRQAEKLEAAEWRDGDVHVPGWGAEDDAAASSPRVTEHQAGNFSHPLNEHTPNLPSSLEAKRPECGGNSGTFLGDSDHLIPVSTGEAFRDRMRAFGVCSVLHVYPGAGHGFFNYGRGGGTAYHDTVEKMTAFLAELGFIEDSWQTIAPKHAAPNADVQPSGA